MTDRKFRFGIVAGRAGTGDEWIAKARRAEELGYSTFLMPDTLNTPAPMPALAFAAAATRSIHLGNYVLVNDLRNPVHVARECAIVDFLSGGRFELGIGVGRPGAEAEYHMLGVPYDSGGTRIERLGEALGIIKALLSGERTSAPGPHYRVADAEAVPRPAQQPRPPILVAGAGRRMLSLAAREADIVALGVSPVEGQAAVAEKVEWIRQAAGDRFDQLELNLNLAVVGQARELPPWLQASVGMSLADLVNSGSVSVLLGTPDEMCEQLLERREALCVSYFMVSEFLMEEFAPVVGRLTGR